jgi:uncharacterized protein (TIGR03085 family)
MSASAHAHRERVQLADLLLELGPDAPTLCAGWTTRDLAAHLVVRESRPDASLGILLPPLAGWTDRVMRAEARTPYPELVRKVRTGPPTLSFFSVPGMDGLANLLEYVVHHEDVRRAQTDWTPRELPSDLADELWARVGQMGRLMYRRVRVGVTLRRTDGPGGRHVVHKGDPMVTLTGSAQDLLLRTYGRTAVLLDVDGPPEAVAALDGADLSL